MSKKVRCQCGAELSISVELEGRVVKCSKCSRYLQVPVAKSSPQSSTASTVSCQCGRRLRVPEGSSLQKLRCPHCKCIVTTNGRSPTGQASQLPLRQPQPPLSPSPSPTVTQDAFADIDIPVVTQTMPGCFQGIPIQTPIQPASFTHQKNKPKMSSHRKALWARSATMALVMGLCGGLGYFIYQAISRIYFSDPMQIAQITRENVYFSIT